MGTLQAERKIEPWMAITWKFWRGEDWSLNEKGMEHSLEQCIAFHYQEWLNRCFNISKCKMTISVATTLQCFIQLTFSVTQYKFILALIKYRLTYCDILPVLKVSLCRGESYPVFSPLILPQIKECKMYAQNSFNTFTPRAKPGGPFWKPF